MSRARIVSGAVSAVLAVLSWGSMAAPAQKEDADGRDARTRAVAVPVIAAEQTSTPGDAGTTGDRDGGGTRDQVVADDLIVRGNVCAGTDCLDGEDLGFKTLLLKHNNARIFFDDTSAGAGFPANDWILVANDSASGGASYFAIEDATAARVPFKVMAGAPADALFVGSNGNVGFRTPTPALDMHLQTGDTPAIRLDQTNASGFVAQTWDIAGNEADFFVRDVTNDSQLPFRIRPGAPTSSLDISGSGAVGVGTSSPASRLDVSRANSLADPAVSMFRVSNPAYPQGEARTRFEIDSDGNVLARGTISQLSSRKAKHAFEDIDGEWLLARLRVLPLNTWSYLDSGSRHAGPVAEDFHAVFGLGASDDRIAPSDLAGVALAAAKALQEELDERDQRIDALERRLAELEARLTR